MQKAKRRQRRLAYKIMTSHTPERLAGDVILFREWLGRNHTFDRYNRRTLCYEPQFTVRYLGPITATSNTGKRRQMLALPGTSHLI
jgi:hypothetical protein